MIIKQPFPLILFLFFCTIFSAAPVFAQIQPNPYTCQDSLRIQPTYPCNNEEYKPVCGCDQKTYKNICHAIYRNGVNFYTDGPCEPFDFDFFPNPVYDYLKLNIALKVKGNTGIIIYNLYGEVFYTQYYRNIERLYAPLSVQNFPNGLYVILMYDDTGFFKLKRFIKYNT